MTNRIPPQEFGGTPVLAPIPGGTVLYRVHRKDFGAADFNSRLCHRYYGGGRFDATADDEYGFLYAGESIEVAIAETLLRDVIFDGTGKCIIPYEKYRGRRVSAIRTTGDLKVVSMLDRKALSSISQSTWLTTCPPSEYAQSRHWGHWIRSRTPGAAGYVWHSRQEPGGKAFVFFEDRHGEPMIEPATDDLSSDDLTIDFDSDQGKQELAQILSGYGAGIE